MLSLRTVLAAGIVLFALALDAATWHVDGAAGNDQNDGRSPQSAWKTIGRVGEWLYDGGDSILFRGGQTFTGALTITAGQFRGSASNPITIGSYGGDRATIVGNDFAIYVENTSGIRVTDLVLRGPGAAAAKAGGGVYFFASGSRTVAGATVERVDVSGFQNGVFVAVAPPARYDALTVDSVVAFANTNAGIEMLGRTSHDPNDNPLSNVTVRGCRVYGNRGTGEVLAVVNATGSGIFVSGADGATIERNVAYDNGGNNPCAPGFNAGPFAIWAYGRRIVMQLNEAWRQHDHPTCRSDNGGFNLNGSDLFLQYNYSHDNDGIAFLMDGYRGNRNNVIRYNLSVNDSLATSEGILWVTGEVSDYEIYHNTLVSKRTDAGRGPMLHIDSDPRVGGGFYQRLRFRNNLFVAAPGTVMIDVTDPEKAVDLLFDSNAFWGSGLVQWGSTAYPTVGAWGGDRRSVTADPLLCKNSARLSPGSPLIDRGADLRGAGVDVGTRDFAGTTIIGPLDIGALESGGHPCPTRVRAVRH